MQESEELPIACMTTYVQGAPAMAVAFPDAMTANQYWSAISEHLTGPFCLAANRGNRQAFVLVMLLGSETGRAFVCEVGEWSDWVSLADDRL